MKYSALIVIAISTFVFTSCGDGEEKINNSTKVPQTDESLEVDEPVVEFSNKGIGPITVVEISDIDDLLATKGKDIYKTNCTACHKLGKRSVGPPLQGVTTRRSPEWIMNMIMNPEEMIDKDPIAIELLEEYMAPMTNQHIIEEDARAILEFLRTKE